MKFRPTSEQRLRRSQVDSKRTRDEDMTGTYVERERRRDARRQRGKAARKARRDNR